MKSLFLWCGLILFAGLLTTGLAADTAVKGKVHHVVCFKFADTATPEQIEKVDADFRALKSKIHLVKSLKAGTNMSPEKLNKGFTHCWELTFKSAADRDAYLVHPAHKAFGQSLGSSVADVFVFDFIAR
jgi:hypothetical protein